MSQSVAFAYVSAEYAHVRIHLRAAFSPKNALRHKHGA
jgi:hypothetical protein